MKQLRELLQYYFRDDRSKDQKLRKANLIVIICELLERESASGEVNRNDGEFSDHLSILLVDTNEVGESDDDDDDAQNIVNV